MQVLVFTVSKDSVVMDDVRSRYVSFRTMEDVGAVDLSRGVAMIKGHHWTIQKFSECWCDHSNIGMPREVQEASRIDTYIAVDPELEKFLSIKHTQEKELILDKLEKAGKKIIKMTSDLQKWHELPWYRRVLIAIKNDYIS